MYFCKRNKQNKTMKKIIVRALLVFMAVSVSNLMHAQKTSTQQQQQGGEVVITQPEFKGGSEALYKYILTNFEYPEEAAKRSISGTMEVEFTVEKSGDISNVGILKGLDEQVDEQVLRLLKAMPRWTPATRNGIPVRYKVSMPLTLKLSKNKHGARSSIGLQGSFDERY